ncbi:hypothetical protein B0H14DRAFT_2636271 [Mycena olivaceomarginata]|nr:hypothetical protein B0H14DRAFT_2636271 [Mycena olivaceomarginata]
MVIVLGTAVDVVENEQTARGGAGMKGNGQVHKLDGCIQRAVWSQMDTSTVLYGCNNVGGCIHPVFGVCAVDVTTILGRCTGQLTKWLKQNKEKSWNKLCKHSCRHPKGWGMGEPPCKMGPAREGKSPKWAVQAQHQASYMPPQEGQWIGAG